MWKSCLQYLAPCESVELFLGFLVEGGEAGKGGGGLGGAGRLLLCQVMWQRSELCLRSVVIGV